MRTRKRYYCRSLTCPYFGLALWNLYAYCQLSLGTVSSIQLLSCVCHVCSWEVRLCIGILAFLSFSACLVLVGCLCMVGYKRNFPSWYDVSNKSVFCQYMSRFSSTTLFFIIIRFKMHGTTITWASSVRYEWLNWFLSTIFPLWIKVLDHLNFFIKIWGEVHIILI